MIDSVTFDFQGRTYEMAYDAERDEYVAEYTAPDKTSWFQPEHVYTGSVTAEIVDVYGDRHSTMQDVGVRVLGDTPPEIRLVSPLREWLFASAAVNYEWSAWTETGAASISATVSGDEIPVQSDGEFDLKLRSDAPVPEGEHAITVTVTDNDGNSTSLTHAFAAFDFITDRTAGDIAAAREAARACTAGEISRADYLALRLKGAYTARDLNRVAAGVHWLSRAMLLMGYGAGVIDAKRDWRNNETPTPDQLQAYIDNVHEMRSRIPPKLADAMGWYLPALPKSASRLGVDGANNLEDMLITGVVAATYIFERTVYFAAGEISAGET